MATSHPKENMRNLRFTSWQEWSRRIRARAQAVSNARADRAWALAASVGIPRNMCCLHNAAIDDSMQGWCKGNPKRLKVAKRANRMFIDYVFEPTRLADRITSRAYRRIQDEMQNS